MSGGERYQERYYSGACVVVSGCMVIEYSTPRYTIFNTAICDQTGGWSVMSC